MLLVCGTWLYELVYKAILMFFMTIYGGAIATAIYNDELACTTETPDSLSDSDVAGTALVESTSSRRRRALTRLRYLGGFPPNFWYILRFLFGPTLAC
jgi:hypothetical protein